jgi:pyruvate-formate lyase-activating enzyme
MQQLPDTFCPAKWDELVINTSYNYVYGCCKARPEKFVNNYNEIIDHQKQNLLNNVQDSSCSYCWNSEKTNSTSLRTQLLKKFDVSTFDEYKNNKFPKLVEINVGNACNMQCMYCNPKFSSQWEKDVQDQKYQLYTDRHAYNIDIKNKQLVDENLELLNTLQFETLRIIGGEPLINKKFFNILDTIDHKGVLTLVSNLMVDKKSIDKLLTYRNKFKYIVINVSLDSCQEISEFVRYGIDYDLFLKNLDYLLERSEGNIKINILSLMTNITLCDIENFSSSVILPRIEKYKDNFLWTLSYCQYPRIQSIEATPYSVKKQAETVLLSLLNNENIKNIDVLLSIISSTKFNKTLFSEFLHFLKQWEDRKNITLPVKVKDLLNAKD